jgi:hypothetical protein
MLGKVESKRNPTVSDYFVNKLGPGDSDRAIDNMRDFTNKLADLPDKVDDDLPNFGLPEHDALVLQSISDLFSRPWFQRLWVIQEVALAKEITVMCGSRQLAWNDLVQLCSELCNLSFMQLTESSHALSQFVGNEGVSSIISINSIHRQVAHGVVPFTELLDAGRRKSVTEPVDRVYGLLGLASQDVRDAVPLDYSEASRTQFWRCYTQISKLCITRDPSLILLSMANSKDRPPELPSWCPNFNSPQREIIDFSAVSGWSAGHVSAQVHGSNITCSPSSNKITVAFIVSDLPSSKMLLNLRGCGQKTKIQELTRLDLEIGCCTGKRAA